LCWSPSSRHRLAPPTTPAASIDWPRQPEQVADAAALIRADHAELHAHLDHLRALADDGEATDGRQLRERLEHVIAFMRDGILAHAAIEEATVYPATDELLRALGGGTRTMALEHELIGARIAELEGLMAASPYDAAIRTELRCALTALDVVLRGHVEKEEQVYVPLLAHLTPAQSETLATELRRAAPEDTSTERRVESDRLAAALQANVSAVPATTVSA